MIKNEMYGSRGTLETKEDGSTLGGVGCLGRDGLEGGGSFSGLGA